jgi:hypothetical protein
MAGLPLLSSIQQALPVFSRKLTSRIASNGARGAPLKLNPKRASMTTGGGVFGSVEVALGGGFSSVHARQWRGCADQARMSSRRRPGCCQAGHNSPSNRCLSGPPPVSSSARINGVPSARHCVTNPLYSGRSVGFG